MPPPILPKRSVAAVGDHPSFSATIRRRPSKPDRKNWSSPRLTFPNRCFVVCPRTSAVSVLSCLQLASRMILQKQKLRRPKGLAQLRCLLAGADLPGFQSVVDRSHPTGGLKRCDQGLMSLPRKGETRYDNISATDSDRDVLQAGSGQPLGAEVTGNSICQHHILLTGGLNL